jgi:hypothetical protein
VDQLPRAGAESAADHEFLAAFGEAGEEEMSEVRAGHEEHKCYSRPSEEKRRAHGTGGFFGERDYERANRCVGIGVRH